MFDRFFRNFFSSSPTYSYPLDVQDAPRGEELIQYAPEEVLYRIGPFYCDKSPVSHTGKHIHAIDFLVPDGTLVKASRSGTVLDVVEHHEKYGPDRSFAEFLNYVTVDHGDGYFSQYAHLEKQSPSYYCIKVGKKFMRGQVISAFGKNGWVEYGEHGDHLHFMVFQEEGDSFMSVPVEFEDK